MSTGENPNRQLIGFPTSLGNSAPSYLQVQEKLLQLRCKRGWRTAAQEYTIPSAHKNHAEPYKPRKSTPSLQSPYDSRSNSQPASEQGFAEL